MAVEVTADLPWLSTATPEEMQRVVEALYRVHRFSAAITDLNTLLTRISEESRLVARAEAASVMLYDEATDEMHFQVALGESGDQDALKREVRLKSGQGIAGTAAQSREPVVVNNAQDDPRFYREADTASRFETRSLLAVPMLERSNIVGVLELVNKTGEAGFSYLDVRVMEMFSSLAASLVHNAQLIEEQRRTERLAFIGQAVASLSHHTKNIVNGLNSSAELIEMGLAQEDLETLRRTWPIFRRSTKRISNYVQDMLAFSKQRQPAREESRIGDIAQEAHDTFRELFAQKNVNVTLDVPQNLRPVFCDPEGIYRCLLNLLTNAADVVPAQDGRIHLAARPVDDAHVELPVSDNGPGIPPEQRKAVFEPFFSTKGTHGTGLGLAVTRKTVAEHGGSVEVQEGPEGGALFRILLPADPREETTG